MNMNVDLIAATAVRALLASAVINVLIREDMRLSSFLTWFVSLWITFFISYKIKERGEG